jgi:hypothetical protein
MHELPYAISDSGVMAAGRVPALFSALCNDGKASEVSLAEQWQVFQV